MNKQSNYQRCFHTHPALPLKDGLVIYGGSCATPAVQDADIYVGFDYSMPHNLREFPWNDGVWFNFPITDMKAPSDPEEFSRLIDWLILQLSANKKVHLGCIGGHGRTGTVLSALVARFLGRKDAIEYVRKNYCEKAVESKVQVDFLVKHFGVDAAEPAKEAASGGTSDMFDAKYGSYLKVQRERAKAPKDPLPSKPLNAESGTGRKPKMTLDKPAYVGTLDRSVPSIWHGDCVVVTAFDKR